MKRIISDYKVDKSLFDHGFDYESLKELSRQEALKRFNIELQKSELADVQIFNDRNDPQVHYKIETFVCSSKEMKQIMTRLDELRDATIGDPVIREKVRELRTLILGQ